MIKLITKKDLFNLLNEISDKDKEINKLKASLDMFVKMCDSVCDKNDGLQQEITYLKKELEKNNKHIPLKVKNRLNGDAECGDCNNHVYFFQKHCVNCGQKLDWRVNK